MAVLGLRFCARAFSSCGERGHSSSRCTGLSLSRPLLLWSTGSRRAGSVIVAHGPSCSWHVGSSQTRTRTRVPCIGRRIVNHCTTREALLSFLKTLSFRAALGIQQNWKEGTEISPMFPAPTHAQPPSISTSLTRMVLFFLPRMNLHWHIIITHSP